MSSIKSTLTQLRLELLNDINKYEEEVRNIHNEIPRTFTRGMISKTKDIIKRINYELNRIENEEKNT